MRENRLGVNSVVLNKWVLDEYVGKGRYGMVYKAHSKDGAIAAIKVISLPSEEHVKEFENAYGGDSEAMEDFFDQIAGRFVAETESLKKLNHKNIISYIDHAASKQQIYWDIVIVMEFAKTLKQYLAETFLSIDKVLSLGIDICNALEQCQNNKIIHRDIKEDNIFIDAMNNFKVGDFGAANMSTATRARTSGVGTLYYMAPEVQSGGNYSYNVDIYSLGIVMYKLLNFNRFPLTPTSKQKEKLGIEDNDAAFKQRFAGAPLLAPESCPQELVPIILKACAFDPAQRYQSATKFKNDLLMVRNNMDFGQLNARVPMPIITTFVPKQPKPVESHEHHNAANGNETIGSEVGTVIGNINDDNPNEKTTDIIQKLIREGGPDSKVVKKIMEKTRALEESQGENRKLGRTLKKRNVMIIASCVLGFILLVGGFFMFRAGYTYNANSQDNYYLYQYIFGKPFLPIMQNPVPVSYVKYDDKWIYFSMHDKNWDDLEDHKLYKVLKNGEELTKLSDDHCEYNIIFGNKIYYLNNKDNFSLYSITKNGTEREKLIDGFIHKMWVEKNLIVYRQDNNDYYFDPVNKQVAQKTN